MYLFVDTETTGLPKDRHAPPSDLDNWPRLVQLAWILLAEDGRELEAKAFIVKPEGFSVPRDASRIHGITGERAAREGLALAFVLAEFAGAVSRSSVLISHNMNFDENVLKAELIRAGVSDILSSMSTICTKESATDYCKLPGRYGKYKWPTLQELHRTLFGSEFEAGHDAAIDVRICAKCFAELKRCGVIA